MIGSSEKNTEKADIDSERVDAFFLTMEIILMKKTFLAITVLSAFAASASAQSSVTLYGALDVGLAKVTNGSAGSVTKMESGAVNTPRFGMTGVEDLGGGLKAGFRLESGIAVDTGVAGAGSTFFNRRSHVSLMGNWGELRLGRDYNPSSRTPYLFEPYIGTSYGTVLGFTSTSANGAELGSGVSTVLRTNNAIAYFTPAGLGGFYGEAMLAPSEGAAAGGKYASARVGYAVGPLDVSYAYGTTTTATTNNFVQSNLGASYNFGLAKVMGLYNQHKWGVRKQNTAALSVVVPMGAGQIWALYGVNDRSGGATGSGYADTDDSKLMSIGYVHSLSKRTQLYGIYGRLANEGAAKLTVDGTAPAGMLGGETSSGFQTGIVHRF